MVGFRLRRHKLVTAVVTFGWLLSVSVGFSRSLSNAFVATEGPQVTNIHDDDVESSAAHYKWLIVGGGIHGVGIAARLVASRGLSNDQFLVIDEHPSLLHSWKERTKATGMAFLRSSAGFHLDIPMQGLKDFSGNYKAPQQKKSKKSTRKAKNQRNKEQSQGFVGSDYQRPALGLFNDHCDLVVEKYRLRDSFFRGRVESIVCPNRDSARVVICTNTSKSTIVSADNIVLAVGNDEPLVPQWASNLSNSTNISHLLQIDSDKDEETMNSSTEVPRVVAIIGGGISAVHKALQLANQNHLVHIVSRHEIREQQFDTHQDWMMTDELAKRSLEQGGKGLTSRQQHFRDIETATERRAVIKRERVPGTVPTYMTRTKGGLEEHISKGYICWHVGEVVNASEEQSSGQYKLALGDGSELQVTELIFATGLGKQPPGHKLIHPLAEEARLPLSPCGYPLVDKTLEWKNSDSHQQQGGSKIFVSGGLAELELGPSARNIAGARMAAERIAQAI